MIRSPEGRREGEGAAGRRGEGSLGEGVAVFDGQRLLYDAVVYLEQNHDEARMRCHRVSGSRPALARIAPAAGRSAATLPMR